MNTSQKKVVIIAGPSGSGKNSILDVLMQRCDICARLVTATTREPRDGEQDGIDYHFITKDTFLRGISDGTIPEYWHAKDTDRYYGTYLPDLDAKFANGKIVLAQVQAEGIRYFKEHFTTIAFCIVPESKEALIARITARHPMTDEEITERMRLMEKEMKEFAPLCDYTIRNPDGKLNVAVDEVISILEQERFIT